ncbi:hypothetical protein FGO68_gene1830 [Halteria grandinella]|uniref:Uncharacterized protein n=1 Tax=Halteria grandinella TaxID=5974 RepID=A0A8J8NK57_HALGN|nr:hypothetical protein FGO68_gene1830 [Halteria grandinella]
MSSNNSNNKASPAAYDQRTFLIVGMCVATGALLARRFSAATAQSASGNLRALNMASSLSAPSQPVRGGNFTAAAAYPSGFQGFQGANHSSQGFSNGKPFRYDPKLSVAFFAFGYFLSFCGDSVYRYCMKKTEVGRQSLLEAQSHLHGNIRK